MQGRADKLTTGQLACFLIAVSMGSAIIFIPSSLILTAGNGAWLSLLGAFGFGMITLLCVLFLHRRHEGRDMVEYSRILIGRTATVIIMIPVIAMLLFATAAIIAGIGAFFISGMMPETPLYIFCSFSLLVATLTARAGIAAAARMFVLLVPIMIMFAVVVLVIALPLYDWNRLLPIFDKGAGPILHGLFITAGFPFGEVCLFALILPYAGKDNSRLLSVRLLLAFGITGISMVIATLCTIAAFGAAAGHFNYSLYQLASNIEIGGTNERIEAVIGVALILGSYMKATGYIIALNRVLSKISGVKDERAFIYPLGLLCTLLSLTLFSSPADFQYLVYQVWPFTVIFVGCLLIYALAGLTLARTKPASRAQEAER
ncbi:GerAB/ArcD/ProY family transporter [Cohnella fermenti]|uniref:GerAB/ArcD/ProY family transporter n=1 Tax=Cohnella fermenti TaxID=2565925 RepID=UPI001454C9FD|nr:endospore germination permease [Cohnella fermenti]